MASSSGGHVRSRQVRGARRGVWTIAARALAEDGILGQLERRPVRDGRGENALPVEAGSDLPVGGQEIRLAKEPS